MFSFILLENKLQDFLFRLAIASMTTVIFDHGNHDSGDGDQDQDDVSRRNDDDKDDSVNGDRVDSDDNRGDDSDNDDRVDGDDNCGDDSEVIMMIALMVMVVRWLEGVCPMLIILWLDPPLLLYLCLLLLSSLKPSCHHHYSKHVIVISTHTHTNVHILMCQ